MEVLVDEPWLHVTNCRFSGRFIQQVVSSPRVRPKLSTRAGSGDSGDLGSTGGVPWMHGDRTGAGLGDRGGV